MIEVRLFGGLHLTAGGTVVDVPSGTPQRLVRMVAAHGSLPSDRAVALLWPDVDASGGRARLRKVLSRVRTGAGDVLVRVGEAVAVGDGVRVDLALFEATARAALAAPTTAEAVGAAKAALAVCGEGELLPEDVYAEWAAVPRERVRRHRLALLDLVAAAAAAEGDMPRALRSWQEAMDLEPYDESRYVVAAQALVERGRWGAAHALLGKADRALAALGLPPSPDLVALRRRMTGDERAG